MVKTFLGTSNEAEVKRLKKIADQVLAKEDEYKALSDSELRAKTTEFKGRVQGGESLDDLLPDAFAAFREAVWRVDGKRLFPVQVMGGICLHQGRIAEMKTGEGKTHTATLPAYLNALTGQGVHIVTVNDYLARFQGEWMGNIFRFMGMNVGVITHDMDNAQRRAAYACDVTYGTNNEMGFDYLRDNMVIREADMVQRGHVFGIVDEVDSILIDEARTPLIISGQAEDSTALYQKINLLVPHLKAQEAEDGPGDYVLKVEGGEGQAPLLYIFGGKLTTYRRLALAALETLAPYLHGDDRPKMAPAWTHTKPLPGGDISGVSGTVTPAQFSARLQADFPWLDTVLLQRLAGSYGSRAYTLLGDARSSADLGPRFGHTLFAREVDFLRNTEWAASCEDILWRRSKLGMYLTAAEEETLQAYLQGHYAVNAAPFSERERPAA